MTDDPALWDTETYKRRNVVERSFSLLKQWRGLATVTTNSRSSIALQPCLRRSSSGYEVERYGLVNAATFGSLTFLAPVVTDRAGLGELWISVALVLFGGGSFVGVTVGGRLSDRRPGPVIAVGGPLLLIGWPALAMLANEPVALGPSCVGIKPLRQLAGRLNL